MSRDEIEKRVKQAISKSSQATVDEIELTDKLKKHVPVEGGSNLAEEIDRLLPKVDHQKLLDSLYNSIKTVGNLVDYVDKIYNSKGA